MKSFTVDSGDTTVEGGSPSAADTAPGPANTSTKVATRTLRARSGRAESAPLRFTVLSQAPPAASSTPKHPTVLVVDFGAQYAQLIARRVRELSVFSEIVPNRISAQEVAARKPAAIILSGGPASVHVDGAPLLDPAIYDLGVPILGI